MNFLKSIVDHLLTFLNYAERQEENAREIERLRTELDRVTVALQISVLQNQHNYENEKHEREKFMLRMKNEWLRRLPPKDDK